MVNDFVVTLANSADPDEMLCFAAFHLGFIVCTRTRFWGSMVYQCSCSSELRVKKKEKNLGPDFLASMSHCRPISICIFYSILSWIKCFASFQRRIFFYVIDMNIYLNQSAELSIEYLG